MKIVSALTKLNEYPKAKKGDVVVIDLTSSYTTAKFKTERVTIYYLAKVTKVAKGLVEGYRKANGSEGIIDPRHRVHVISDPGLQERALALFNSEAGTMDFDDIEDIKKAILGRN